jgi:Tol biopolymer transport system component
MPVSRRVTRFCLLSVLIEWGVVVIIIVGLLFLRGAGKSASAPAAAFTDSPVARSTAMQVTELPRPASLVPPTASWTPLPTILPLTWTASSPPPVTPQGPRGRIVFTCTIEKYNQLCLMNADGSGWKRLTDRSANDYYPSISSDGTRIVFVSNQTGMFEIYQRYLALSEEQQLTDGVGSLSAPEISPDGLSVIYAAKFAGGDSSIWTMRIDGTGSHPLTDAQWSEIDPSWSPDGKQIAFAAARGGYVELFTMDATGSDIRQVTNGLQGIGGRSSWSPDGRWLAFYAGPRGDRDIYLVEVASGIALRLTYGGNNTAPCFSPDGLWLAFSSSRDGDHEIFLMRLDGSQVTQLTDNDYDDWQPSWGP